VARDLLAVKAAGVQADEDAVRDETELRILDIKTARRVGVSTEVVAAIGRVEKAGTQSALKGRRGNLELSGIGRG
jgi:hypothetical protein